MSWLFDSVKNSAPIDNKNNKNKAENSDKKFKKIPFRSFGERFNAAMNIAGLSNARLGKLVNLDASYISRIRNGFRMPNSNSKTIDLICSSLISKIREQGRFEALGKIAEFSQDELYDEELCKKRFKAWPCDFKADDSAFALERLIKNIENFSFNIFNAKILPSSFDAITDELTARSDSVYFGIEGLKDAVIRFLGSSVKNGASEMWLYSDQDMGWMIDDAEFHMKWAFLMRECVKNGVKIRIIHNIDRDLDEMIEAFNGWLPLYMSGMIESWYSRKQNDGRFSHTLFICPEYFCIEGCNVSGSENNGVYRYHMDLNMIKIFQDFYQALLAPSRRLIYISTDENFELNKFLNLNNLKSDDEITILTIFMAKPILSKNT